MKEFNLLRRISRRKGYRFYLYYTNNSSETTTKHLWSLSLYPYILGYAEFTTTGRDLNKVIKRGLNFLKFN